MEQKLKDEKIKVVKLTKYLRGLPSTKQAYLLIILTSIIIGAISYYLLTKTISPIESLKAGTIIGLVFLGLPAITTALLTTISTMKTDSKISFKESIYLAIAGMLLITIPYLIGIALSNTNPLYLIDLLIFGYSGIFLLRVITIILITPNGIIKSTPIALIHPLTGFLFVSSITAINTIYTLIPMPQINIWIFAAKAAASLAIMVGTTILLIKALDAPMIKNFGMKSTTLTRAFLAHWLNNSLDIEEKMAPSTEKINALVGITAFKAKNKLKAVLITPYLHPGPFAEIGGAKLAKEIMKIDKTLDTTTLVAHGTATHDLNPMRTEDLAKIRKAITQKLKSMKFKKEKLSFEKAKTKEVEMTAFKIGEDIFMSSTFCPEATEDIDLSIGKSIMNKMEKHFKTAIYADAHNCNKSGHFTLFSGDPRTAYLEQASDLLAEKLLKAKKEEFKLGTSTVKIKGYFEKDGIGTGGIRTLLFKTRKEKNALIIIDANNIKPNVRKAIMQEIKKMGIDKAEVMTTDSHTVNNIQGVYNPFGERIPLTEIKKAIRKGIEKAEEDLEEVQTSFEKITIPGIRVLGMQRASELIATINSIVSTMLLLGPFVIASGILLSLLSILLIPW